MQGSVATGQVLFIAYYFPPLGMGGTQRIAKFCKYLARAGWQVSVITVKPIAYYAYDFSLLEELSQIRIIRTGSLDPGRLFYLLQGGKESTTPGRAGKGNWLYWFLLPDPRILWAPFALWQAWREIRKHKISHVVTSGPPHSSHFIGWLLSRFVKIRWVSDFRDTWLREEFPQAPTFVHRRLQNGLERLIVQKAHVLTAVSSSLLQELIDKGARKETASYLLPHGFDDEDFSVEFQRNEKRFTVTYVGAISHIQDPRTLLQGFGGFAQLVGLAPDEICLHFVGADVTGELEKWIAELNLVACTRFAGYQPHRLAVQAMLSADLLVFIANPGTGRTVIPSKTFEYIAAGKPVLAIGEKIEGVEILLENAVCRHCEFDDVAGITRALLAFYGEHCKGELPPPPSRRMEFSREQLAHKLAQILNAQ